MCCPRRRCPHAHTTSAADTGGGGGGRLGADVDHHANHAREKGRPRLKRERERERPPWRRLSALCLSLGLARERETPLPTAARALSPLASPDSRPLRSTRPRRPSFASTSRSPLSVSAPRLEAEPWQSADRTSRVAARRIVVFDSVRQSTRFDRMGSICEVIRSDRVGVCERTEFHAAPLRRFTVISIVPSAFGALCPLQLCSDFCSVLGLEAP